MWRSNRKGFLCESSDKKSTIVPFEPYATADRDLIIAAGNDSELSEGLMITPYENATGGDPRFMHLYELGTDDPERWFKGMPDRVAAHLGGGPGTPAFDDWAFHPALRILYVNTFRRMNG